MLAEVARRRARCLRRARKRVRTVLSPKAGRIRALVMRGK
jgi:hypothetical protein